MIHGLRNGRYSLPSVALAPPCTACLLPVLPAYLWNLQRRAAALAYHKPLAHIQQTSIIDTLKALLLEVTWLISPTPWPLNHHTPDRSVDIFPQVHQILPGLLELDLSGLGIANTGCRLMSESLGLCSSLQGEQGNMQLPGGFWKAHWGQHWGHMAL